jgi:hypothetical protein
LKVAYDNNHTTQNEGTIFGIQGRFNYISTGLGVIEVSKTVKFQEKIKYVTVKSRTYGGFSILPELYTTLYSPQIVTLVVAKPPFHF